MTTEQQSAEFLLRPDPVFKDIVRSEAVRRGLTLLETQFPQLLTADFLLYAPPEVSLVGTKFDFFHLYNMMDFKSENDNFDEREYTKNEIRVGALYLQKPELKKDDILNLFICSYQPKTFFAYMRQAGCPLKRVKGRKWLWHAKVGLQNLAVVVCRDLPLEQEYYRWLAFAPTNTKNWKKLVNTLMRTGGDWELLKLMQKMRPKEVGKIMVDTLREITAEGKYTPEYAAELKTAGLVADLIYIATLAKGLPPEIFAQMVDVDELLKVMPLENRLASISLEKRLASIPVEERLASIPVEERLSGIEPEQRLAGLSPEEEEKLFKLLSEKRSGKQSKDQS